MASEAFAEKHLGSLEGVPSVRAVSTVTPRYPQHLPELPDIATDSTAVVPAPDRVFKDQILDAAYAEAGIGPEDLSLAEVYDLSTALELDWYEHLGLCPKGEAEQLLRSGATTIGGRIPVNPSGGLACFGEAIPAQAIAQVCELTWQLRVRPPAGRSRAPPSASPPTRACSATARRSSLLARQFTAYGPSHWAIIAVFVDRRRTFGVGRAQADRTAGTTARPHSRGA